MNATQQAFNGAKVFSIAPDMSIVNNGRRPAVVMPSDLFGPAWSVIEQVADNTSTAPDYAGIALLSVCASLIGGKRFAAPYGSSWKVPAILWASALGDPSSRKSAPLNAIANPLWRLQEDANAEHAERKRDWEAEVERAKAERAAWKEEVKGQAGTEAATLKIPAGAIEPDEPAHRRFVIKDCTPEAAAFVLKDNPQGVLAHNDELAGWLQSFDRYNSGGRPFWLEAFEGQPFSVSRKGEGSFDLSFLGISVLGSIQPDKLSELLEGANDGLVPRIIWAWPEKRTPRRPRTQVDTDALVRAYERLELLPWGSDQFGTKCAKVLPFSAAAADVFEDWDADNSAGEKDSGSLYESFCGKMSGAVVRLALVAELMAWAFGEGPEPEEISEQSVLAAIMWVEDYAKPMAERVFGDASVSQSDRNASLLARYILKHRLEKLNVRDLRRSPHKSALKPLQAKNALDDAIEALELAGWISADPSREGGSKGRASKDYTVKPAVFEARS